MSIQNGDAVEYTDASGKTRQGIAQSICHCRKCKGTARFLCEDGSYYVSLKNLKPTTKE